MWGKYIDSTLFLVAGDLKIIRDITNDKYSQ